MRCLRCIALCIVLASLGACTTQGTQTGTAGTAGNGANQSIAAGQDLADTGLAWLSGPDPAEQLVHINELESQILAFLNDQPLKLGPLGAALLEFHPQSLPAHLALVRYYSYLEETEVAAEHQQWIDSTITQITAVGDGTRNNPYQARTRSEAVALMMARDNEYLGSVYTNQPQRPLMLVVTSAPLAGDDNGRHNRTYFDLSATFNALRAAPPAELEDDFNAGNFVVWLAEQEDDAAQTALGGAMLGGSRHDVLRAVGYLRSAVARRNLVASLFLAEAYLSASRDLPAASAVPEDDNTMTRDDLQNSAISLYREAVLRGSAEAMYQLGLLGLQNQQIQLDEAEAVQLITDSADLDHLPAVKRLASYYIADAQDEEDTELGRQRLLQAIALGDRWAALTTARLGSSSQGLQLDESVFEALEGLAEGGDAEAMIVLGNLHGGGYSVSQSDRRARRWYRKAVPVAEDPEHINELAWTLAVSQRENIRDPKRALALMEKLMTPTARSRKLAAHLDTWAACYAAIGDFDRAVSIQEQALEAAIADDDDDETLAVLRVHLSMFREQKVVIDPVP